MSENPTHQIKWRQTLIHWTAGRLANVLTPWTATNDAPAVGVPPLLRNLSLVHGGPGRAHGSK